MPESGSADLAGTGNFALFQTAEQLHKTVRELVTGQTGPLTSTEQYLWNRYRLATARLQQQARPIHKV